jgi:hypothetical protein
MTRGLVVVEHLRHRLTELDVDAIGGREGFGESRPAGHRGVAQVAHVADGSLGHHAVEQGVDTAFISGGSTSDRPPAAHQVACGHGRLDRVEVVVKGEGEARMLVADRHRVGVGLEPLQRDRTGLVSRRDGGVEAQGAASVPAGRRDRLDLAGAEAVAAELFADEVVGNSEVQPRPPTRARASRTSTRYPASARSRAARRPAKPAPTTMTSCCGLTVIRPP